MMTEVVGQGERTVFPGLDCSVLFSFLAILRTWSPPGISMGDNALGGSSGGSNRHEENRPVGLGGRHVDKMSIFF